MRSLPGLVLAALVAVPAYFAGRAAPTIGGPVFAIALGALVGLVPRSAAFGPGLRLASKKGLQAAVAMLGFGMNFVEALRIGGGSLAVMAATVSAAFLCALAVSRVLRVRGKAPALIAIGTAICGASAIAAAAPAMEADDEDTAYAIATIFVFNIAAVIVFPAAGRLLGMSDYGFGVWAGTAVNDTSSVVAAGLAFSRAALETATVVKLTRTLLIIPIVLILVARTARLRAAGSASAGSVSQGSASGGSADSGGAGASGATGAVRSAFPWFVLWFVAASASSSLGLVPAPVATGLAGGGRALILVAMAGIGLGVKPSAFAAAGWRPLVLGLACWVSVAVSSLLAQAALERW
ncbi:MAG: putative sulfate exporter family transporter [Spirochaetes bacterium]|nr:putative sulfate exporter family transporter [Spirochaetota bacterium]MBU1080282.1 putative sulfate exporter family transporter [Spirochaetota bacterium]